MFFRNASEPIGVSVLATIFQIGSLPVNYNVLPLYIKQTPELKLGRPTKRLSVKIRGQKSSLKKFSKKSVLSAGLERMEPGTRRMMTPGRGKPSWQ